MKNEMPNDLIGAIHQDNVEKVEYITTYVDKELIKSKNDIGWTILHYCAVWGSEKVFDWIYPQLKKPRLNMFDKHDKTPFHKAIVGPSEHIFETLLKDGKVEVTKCKAESGYSVKRTEAIFQLVVHPEFKHRVIKYYDHVDEHATMWSQWFEQAMFEGRLWAIKLVIEQKEYDDISDYFKKHGLIYALRGDQRKVIEYIAKHDTSILESNETANVLSESLRWPDRFAFLLSLMTEKLDKPLSGMYYDGLIMDMCRYENAIEYFDMVNKKDILISDNLLMNMIEGRKFGTEFLQSCMLRSDYSSFILPILLKNDIEGKHLPDNVKDIFSF